MKKFIITILLFAFLILALVQMPFFNGIQRYLAALFFPERISPEELIQKYKSNENIKILIVPGHDDESWGASFNGVKEAELNLEVGGNLLNYFKSDEHFEAFTSRDKDGYTADFQNYFQKQYSLILEFRKYWQTVFRGAVKKGLVEEKILDYHGTASNEISLKLYGINKWANDNKIDIVIHLHFNDYPGRRAGRVGKYSGFSMYVPESQLPNARASRELALSIYNQLKKYLEPSDLPIEKDGIIEDQELIAIGSNASLNAVSVLIEYGYIYEPQFTHNATRPYLMRELAFQTYMGVKKYFEPPAKLSAFESSLLPYEWQNPLEEGMRGRDILALQSALISEGLYDCPLTGYFGPCTRRAVAAFQTRFGLPASGSADTPTIRKMNELY